MKEKALDLVADLRLDLLDMAITADAEYGAVRKEQLQLQEQLETMEPSEELKAIVYELLTKANECNAIYGKSAYKQGFRDGAECMKDLKKKQKKK